jgi:DNA-binding transcriptional LysR family regulator
MIKESSNIFRLAASYTIGSYILPGKPISDISKRLESKIQLQIGTCDKIIDGVKDGRYNLGLIETPIFDKALVYKEWLEDELVICSKVPIPQNIDKRELNRYRLIARKEDSLTRMVISNALDKIGGLSYDNFKSVLEMDNPTAIIQSIKWSKPNKESPTIAIVSQLSIEDELNRGELYISRIKDNPIIRKFYLIYNQELNNTIKNIDEIIDILRQRD